MTVRAERPAHLRFNEVIEALWNASPLQRCRFDYTLTVCPHSYQLTLIFMWTHLIASTSMALNPGSLSNTCCICEREEAEISVRTPRYRPAFTEANVINSELVNNLAGSRCVGIKKDGMNGKPSLISMFRPS